MPMERGRTSPHLIKFNNNRKYVVKFKNNPLGDFVLVKEFVVYQLAKKLKLPVPGIRKAYISEKFISKNKMLRKSKFKPGTQIASRYVENSVRLSEVPRPLTKHDIANRNQAARMIVFDHWVRNTDRSLQNNILLQPVGDKYKLYFIDNGQSFGRSKVRIRNKESFKWLYSLVKSDKELLSFAKKIKSFPKKEILRILSRLPKDWNVPEKKKKQMYRQLENSKHTLLRKIKHYLKHHAGK